MRGEILGRERRRRLSDDQTLALILEVDVRGATVTQVAQRHEITRQQNYEQFRNHFLGTLGIGGIIA